MVALVAACLLWPSAPVAPGPPPPDALGPRVPVPEQMKPPPAAPPQLARETPGGPGAAPVIDEVTVEKKEVCEGEENLVSVKAHTTDGSDPFLHYLVGSTPGQRVPLRTWLADDGEQPKLEVKAFGRNNAETAVPVPPFLVKSCRPKHVISLLPHLKSNTFGDYVFEAKIVEPPPLEVDGKPAPPFKASSYEWTFGDGESAVTPQPFAEHSYESRRQDALYSHLLVQVTARGEGGESVTGRASLQLLNMAYEDLAGKGVVTLMVQLTPRFPELGADGVVHQRVRLFHFRDKPVYVQTATVVRHRAGDPTGNAIPEREDPFQLMGGNIIPPGHGLEFEARLDTRKDADIFSLEHLLEGKDDDGLPARGAFSVMRPPELPTKQGSMPVTDPALKQKILAARRILNTPYVTDEDLMRLEREGKFADLPPVPPQAPPSRSSQGQAPPPGPPPPGPTGPGDPPL
ncbi:MAG TPA: PKD domain-containing protein, partial [Myxococcales bacterium]|nr:PKD domain-containing protein [Myxococcales bacterium]